MSFIRGGETILIKRRSQVATDDFGNPTYTVATQTIKEALIGVGGTSEPVDPARDAQDASVTVYLPAGTQIQDGDTFVIRGSEWQRDGDAQDWVSPFPGDFGGVVVPLRRRRG
jgi:hypothetical protein